MSSRILVVVALVAAICVAVAPARAQQVTKETLDGVFAAVPDCIDLIGGPYIETDPALVKAFRPKSALRPRQS